MKTYITITESQIKPHGDSSKLELDGCTYRSQLTTTAGEDLGKRNSTPCLWKYRIMQSLQKSIWGMLRQLKIDLPYPKEVKAAREKHRQPQSDSSTIHKHYIKQYAIAKTWN